MWTLVTSGQVASNTCSARRAASCSTAVDTPCAENTTVAPSGTSFELLDEHRAQPAQALDHMTVVYHFVAHVDRRAEQLQRALDDLDRPIDAGTETTGIG